MKIKVSLNKAGSIQSVIKKLQAYEDSLDVKMEKFISRLADVGVQAAYMNTGQYNGYIMFRKKVTGDANGVRAVIIGSDITKIVREWKSGHAIVSPLLMAEFGSGWKAINPHGVKGVGQGTFPGQTHAFDKQGWFWEDNNPEGAIGERKGYYLHHSYGESPSLPMHHACVEMIADVQRIAREVFR